MVTVLLFSTIVYVSKSQDFSILPDSVQKKLETTAVNERAKYLLDYSWQFRIYDSKSALRFTALALELARKNRETSTQAKALNYLAVINIHSEHFNEAYSYCLEAKEIASEVGNKEQVAYSCINLAMVQRFNKEYYQALFNLREAQLIMNRLKDISGIAYVHTRLSEVFLDLKILDSAMYHARKVSEKGMQLGNMEVITRGKIAMANAYMELGKYRDALEIYQGNFNDSTRKNQIGLLIAKTYIELKQYDSALVFARQVFINARSGHSYKFIQSASKDLSVIFEHQGVFDSSLYYKKIENIAQDSLAEAEKLYNIDLLQKSHEIKLKSKEMDLLKERNEFNKVLFSGMLIVIVIVFFFAYVQRKHKMKEKNDNLLLQAQNDKIEVQSTELKEMIITKDKFFSIIAHDLKNPLGSFRELSKMMSENYELFDDAELREYLNMMKNSADSVFELLENLLEWSRSQRGLIQFSPQEFNLNFIAHNCVELLRLTADKKSIKLINRIPENYPIFADPNLITTIIRNLISNAIKFTNSGGEIIIACCTPPINSEPETDNNCSILDKSIKNAYYCIYVRDSGLGMSDEIKSKLFRIDKNITTVGTSGESGTGLGLILCKEFAQLHQGTIWAESEINKGSTFYFTISKELSNG